MWPVRTGISALLIQVRASVRRSWIRFLNHSNPSSKAEPGWVWRSSIKSCRHMMARYGHGRRWDREASSFYGCIARPRRQKHRQTVTRFWRPQLRRREGRVGNILVCDDERSICAMLEIALRRDGYKIETERKSV